jgi:hypothetical protein
LGDPALFLPADASLLPADADLRLGFIGTCAWLAVEHAREAAVAQGKPHTLLVCRHRECLSKLLAAVGRADLARSGRAVSNTMAYHFQVGLPGGLCPPDGCGAALTKDGGAPPVLKKRRCRQMPIRLQGRQCRISCGEQFDDYIADPKYSWPLVPCISVGSSSLHSS